MIITSSTFAIFVLIVLFINYLLPRKWQNLWLLATSYYFYSLFGLRVTAVLVVFTLVNYGIGRDLAKAQNIRKFLLWVGIIFNIGVLAFFKYSDFFLTPVLNGLKYYGFEIENSFFNNLLPILLPVGLSFLILQTISYLMDIYNKQIDASRNLIDFSLYLVYFPKMLSGPIERAKTFLPKLAEPRIVNNELLERGFTLIVVGLIRKLVIADTLVSMIPTELFEDPSSYPAVSLVGWLLAFGFSLYNDFAGYTNIVRGVSGLFGIELTQNFQRPYFAKNITEFWNRWHISLSHWLRDYIFFPLNRALKKRFRSRDNLLPLLIPPMVTMLASGLWHEASWNMLFWGGLHGTFLVTEQLSQKWRSSNNPRWRGVIGRVGALIFVFLAWIPFQVDLAAAWEYISGIFAWESLALPDLRILLVVGLSIGIDWIQEKAGDEVVFLRWPMAFRAGALGLAILAILFVSQADLSFTFIYQGF